MWPVYWVDDDDIDDKMGKDRNQDRGSRPNTGGFIGGGL